VFVRKRIGVVGGNWVGLVGYCVLCVGGQKHLWSHRVDHGCLQIHATYLSGTGVSHAAALQVSRAGWWWGGGSGIMAEAVWLNLKNKHKCQCSMFVRVRCEA
jgi:hypothetical protein